MINMLGIHLQQDFAMHQGEMKNERELHHQELDMQQQMLQLQQQMMNMFVKLLMGQKNNKKHCSEHSDVDDNKSK